MYNYLIMTALNYDQKSLNELCRQFDLILAIAYGSQVTGHAGPNSDTDIGVLQRTGRIPTDQYVDLSYQLSQIIRPGDIDLVDFRRVPGLLRHLACKTGVVLFEGEPGTFANFRLLAWNLYQDERTAIRRHDREAIQTALRSFSP